MKPMPKSDQPHAHAALNAVRDFIALESASGILLLAAAVLAYGLLHVSLPSDQE